MLGFTKRKIYIAASLTVFLLLAGFSIFLSSSKPPSQVPIKAASKSIEYTIASKSGLESSAVEAIVRIESDPASKEVQVLITSSQVDDISNVTSITLPLFENGIITFDKEKVITNGEDFRTWSAKKTINGITNRLYLTFNKSSNLYYGNIKFLGETYIISSLNSSTIAIRKNVLTITTQDSPMESSERIEFEKVSDNKSVQGLSSSGDEIDVLFAYTQGARNFYSSYEYMIYDYLNQTNYINDLFEDSGIIHRLRYVGVAPMPSHETQNCQETLYRLWNQNDQYFMGIEEIREQNGADIVVLVVRPPNSFSCSGTAMQYAVPDEAYAVVLVDAIDEIVFPHELGHIFGAHHEKNLVTNANFSYGHAYNIPELEAHTIMGYGNDASCSGGICENLIPMYSNPDKFYNGKKIGNSETANNARVINTRGPGVAGFRASAYSNVPGSPPNGTGSGTCGSYCHTAFDCDPNGNYTCKDVGNGAKNCWNESACGGPALKARIEGYVRSCSNQPLTNIKVKAWGNTALTDSNGRFRLNKGVDHTNIQTMETSIMAGNDAARVVEGQDKYFTSNYANLSLRSAPQGCSIVNCAFTSADSSNPNKLLNGGPARNAYYIPSTMPDDTFEYNFVFTDQYAKSFDFKPPNCLSCDQACASDSQCSATNNNWYCARQYNYTNWTNVTSYFNTPGSGIITDLNLHLNSNNQMEEHVVRGGQVYYRLNTGSGGSFSNVTTNLDDEVGCTAPYPVLNPTECTNSQGIIKTFNSYTYPESGSITNTEQHVIRVKDSTVKLFSRDSLGGWGSWQDNTSGVNNIGNVSGQSNNLTSFTSYYAEDNYRMQTLVRGGRVYLRAIFGFYGWGDNTSIFNSCSANGLCGYSSVNGVSNPIISFELVKKANNQIDRYLLRADGQVYKSTSLPLDEKCRLKSKPWSLTCQ